tara:strand:- start:15 stop:311 length:297 start_codon:yes stop_codon:yes gene_type:complete
MQNNQRKIEETHEKYNEITLDAKSQYTSQTSRRKFPYEFLASADRGWIPCDIVESDMEKELVKVVFYHPDFNGWMNVVGSEGIYDDVVQMWRVRLRED